MSRPASTRFTLARTKSNDAPSGILLSSLLKRPSSHFVTGSGIYRLIALFTFSTILTRVLAIFEELNTSSPSVCDARLLLFSTTLRAFFDILKATTITTPLPTKKKGFKALKVGFTLSVARTLITYSSGPAPLPLAAKSMYDSSPDSGTPIKFTKSLPAKAIASENVPNRTITLKTLTFSISRTNITAVKVPRNVITITL